MVDLRGSWPWWRTALTGLSSLALALSALLSWHYLAGGQLVGCGDLGAAGCDQALSSRWSTVAGILPISGLAAGAYLAILVASLSIGPATAAPVRRLAWIAMLILVGAAVGSAVWFTIVQKWIIGAFCAYCLVTHITGLLLAVLVIWQAPRQVEDDSRTPASLPAYSSEFGPAGKMPAIPVIRPLRSAGLCLIGAAFAGVLAVCQVSFKPPTVYHSGRSQNNLAAIGPHDAPLVGSPDARYIVTLLFDYNCSHCQQLHFMLDEAIRRYKGELAFVLCPAPLNTQCNPYVSRNVDEFRDSCELAKIGLAVWVARRDAFPAFNRWMFSLESGDRWRPRSVDAAHAKAVELVGQARFDAARSDPWIDRYMQTSIRIYGDTGSNAIPKLVFGSRWVTPNGAGDLVSILQDSLGVPKP